jgi:hypothetical protein
VCFHVGSTSGEKEKEKQKIELGTFQNLERSGKQKKKKKELGNLSSLTVLLSCRNEWKWQIVVYDYG